VLCVEKSRDVRTSTARVLANSDSWTSSRKFKFHMGYTSSYLSGSATDVENGGATLQRREDG